MLAAGSTTIAHETTLQSMCSVPSLLRTELTYCFGPNNIKSFVFKELADSPESFEVGSHNKFKNKYRGKNFSPQKLTWYNYVEKQLPFQLWISNCAYLN